MSQLPTAPMLRRDLRPRTATTHANTVQRSRFAAAVLRIQKWIPSPREQRRRTTFIAA